MTKIPKESFAVIEIGKSADPIEYDRDHESLTAVEAVSSPGVRLPLLPEDAPDILRTVELNRGPTTSPLPLLGPEGKCIGAPAGVACKPTPGP